MKKFVYLLIISAIILSSTNITSSFQIAKEEQDEILNRFDYDQRYAVIIVGSYGVKNQEDISGVPREKYYEWYTGSAQRKFDILTESYGFSAENIYVLVNEIKKDGYTPNPNFNPSKFVNYYNATKENITMVFNELKNKIDDNDFLVVEIINHGGDDGRIRIPIIKKYIDINTGVDAHDTFMALEKKSSEDEDVSVPQMKNQLSKMYNVSMMESDNYKLYDYELASFTKVINARRILFIIQPCFSGGFINDLSKENHVIFTASTETQMAGNFLGPLDNGFEGSAEDLNCDGNISLAEIFAYTISHLTEEGFDPMIDDNGDQIGHEYLGDGDGIIASGIYDLSYEIIDYNTPENYNSRPFNKFDNYFPILRQLFQIFKNG